MIVRLCINIFFAYLKSKHLPSRTPCKLQKIVSKFQSIKLMHLLQEKFVNVYIHVLLASSRVCFQSVRSGQYSMWEFRYLFKCMCVRRSLSNRGLPRHCWDPGILLQWETACFGSEWRHMSSEGWVTAPRLPISSSAGYNSPPMPAALAGYLTTHETTEQIRHRCTVFPQG